MKTLVKGAALAAVVAWSLPTATEAQPGPRGQRGPAMDRGGGVEMVMRLRDRLELSDDQVEELDALRQEAVERRTAHRAQMAELLSRVRAGEMTRQELREIAQARREGAEEVREEQRRQIEAVLTEEQLQEVETLRAGARGFARGRASARQGRGGMGGFGGGAAWQRGGMGGLGGGPAWQRGGMGGFGGGPAWSGGRRGGGAFQPGARRGSRGQGCWPGPRGG